MSTMHIDHVRLLVVHFAECFRFYRDVIGLTVKWGNENDSYASLDKIAAMELEKLHQKMAEFIEKSGFDGIAPTPKEAAHTVALARHLPRLVEY